MSSSIMESARVTAGTDKAGHRLARAATIAGGILSFPALALGSAQLYRVSAATLGPGAFMLSIPKILAASLAPLLAVAGVVGAALGLSALWLERGRYPRAAKGPGQGPGQVGTRGSGLGAPLVVLAGLTAATLSAVYTQQVVASNGNFAAAFGAGWQERMPSRLKGGMLAQRWTWNLAVAPGAHVERDLAFATVPVPHQGGSAVGLAVPGRDGSPNTYPDVVQVTDRKLLADVWTPPDGVAPSGLGFIYLHGGGYTAFDKGGPTEPWFRHLAAQGHVVMDVSYRLIPETNFPGMLGDVKRAIAWLKRNAGRYGVDPDHIVLGGGSGGSHLALLAAYTPDHPLFTPEDVRGEDLSVRGVVGYYNAGDYRRERKVIVNKTALERTVAGLLTGFLERWTASKIAVDDTGDWDGQVFFGGRPDEWPELYRQISPITHVGPNTPPTLQFMGEHDVYVSRSPAIGELHAKLQAAGVPSITIQIPRTDHAFDMFLPEVSPAAQTAMYHADRFLALMASPIDWKTASSN